MTWEIFFRIAGLICLIYCSIHLPSGWQTLHKSIYLIQHGQLTTGYTKGDRRIQFTTDTGKTFQFYSQFSPRIIGKPFPILYDPKNPYRAYLAPSTSDFQPMLQITGSCAFFLTGLSLLLGFHALISIFLFIITFILGFITSKYYSRYSQKVVARRFQNM
jgi:hypothetical protein